MRARASIVLLACVGALALGVVARSAGGPAPSFRISAFLGLGDACNVPTFAIGDLNGDGRPDLATACPYPQSQGLLLYRNRGRGRFVREGDLPLEDETVESVAIGDLNGDGIPDLAALGLVSRKPYSEAALSLLFNQGDGTYRRVDYPWYGDQATIADLNGDGRGDLVITHRKSVSVLLNPGDDSFASPVNYATGRGGNGGIALGDLNGDRALDVVTPNDKDGTVSVFLNKGDGTLGARRDYATLRHPASVAIGDLNGDGKPDVATTGWRDEWSEATSVLVNRGDGMFKPRRDFRGGGGSVAIGDLNGDGAPDLVTTSSRGVSIFFNRGAARFGGRLDYRSHGWRWDSQATALADFDGDGRLDLAIASVREQRNYVTSDLAVLLNTPGLCNVQYVRGLTPSAARRKLARVNCRVGRVARSHSRLKAGRVISTKPLFGAVRPRGAKVDLVVSLGRKR